MATGEQRVEAVERALSLLDCFDEQASSQSLAELAEKTGFYKSTILRLAASLQRYGYLDRGEDGLFHLGPSLWRLGSLYRRGFDLGDAIRPELRRLVEITGETASYYVREGERRVCLYRHNSPRAARHHLSEGESLSLEGGASARVLRALAGEPGKACASVRERGHAVSLGERDPEVAAVSVPLLDEAGQLRGALAVSGLISRFDAKRRRKALAALVESSGRLKPIVPPAE